MYNAGYFCDKLTRDINTINIQHIETTTSVIEIEENMINNTNNKVVYKILEKNNP